MFLRVPCNSIQGWYFTPDEMQDALTSKRMLNSSIDLSNTCNLNCPYCYVEERDSPSKIKKPNELSSDEIKKVIDDIYTCGARTINIVGAGEPTVDPHFEDIISYICERRMCTVLFTNGIRLSHDHDLVQFLYDHNVSVVLKYNSRDRRLQDLVVGQAGYSNERDKALDLLLDAGFTNNFPTRLGVDITIFKGNLNEIPLIYEWCRQKNIFPIAGEYIPTGRTEGGVFQGLKSINGQDEDTQALIRQVLSPISESDRHSLLKKTNIIDAEYGIKRNRKWAYLGGGICTQILGLYIDIEGNIWPCVARKKKIGNYLFDGQLGNTRNGDLPSKVWKESRYIHTLLYSYDGGCPYRSRLVLDIDVTRSSS